jgi:hypothetical protein
VAESYVEILALRNRPGGLSIAAQPPHGLAAAQQALQALGLEEHEPSPQADRTLIARSQEQDDHGALLCLRCRISHPIRDKIQALYNSHQEKHGLDLIEMASFVLDDDGALEFPARTGERRGAPFRWSVLSSLPEKALHPFSAEVLRSYNPALCGLPHWARQKVQCHPELKTYLRQHGLLLISNWALLAHKTSPNRLRQAWSEYGTGMGLEQAMALHQAFQAHYPPAQKAYVARTGKRSGWEPDEAFLLSLLPGVEFDAATQKLKDLATAVRAYLTATAAAQELPEPDSLAMADPATLSKPADGSSPQELMALIQAALERATPPAVQLALDDDQPSWAKKPERHRAWQLYGEGLGQREIAERCGHKQAWVSKLLDEQSLATTIATAAAVELRRHPAFSEVALSVEGAERLVAALRNHLTNPEREGEVAPLRRAVADTLASMQP